MLSEKSKKIVIGFGLGFLLLMSSCVTGPRAVRVELPKIKQVHSIQAFVHATVIPMTEPDKVIEDAIVIVENKTITYVGTDYTMVPLNSEVIDCTGKWIVPGLADAHVHLLFNTSDPLLFLANGVTSVRNMAALTDAGRLDARFAFNDHVRLRDSISKAEVLSPWVYQASPIHEARKGMYFDSSLYVNTHSAFLGTRAVQIAHESGFDYFKIYNKLPRDAFYSVINEAGKFGMPVVGHVPHEVSIQEVIDGSLMHSIEHLTGYINPFGTFKFSFPMMEEIAIRTAQAGIWNVPTLEVWRNIVAPEFVNAIDVDPWTRYVPKENRKIWSNSIKSFTNLIQKKVKGYDVLPSDHLEDFELIVQALIKAKAPIAAGTDSGTLNVVAGSSLHRELQGLVKLGMTEWEALSASTIRVAQCCMKADEFGSVQAGLRADLLVLNSNPLENIANLRDISLVIVQGVPYRQSELVNMLDSYVSKHDV